MDCQALHRYKRPRRVEDFNDNKRLRNMSVKYVRKAKQNYSTFACSQNNQRHTWSALCDVGIGSCKNNFDVPQNLSNCNDMNIYFSQFSQK